MRCTAFRRGVSGAERWRLVGCLHLAIAAGAGAQGLPWLTLAGSPGRGSMASTPPALLGVPRWVASVDNLGQPITFEGQTSVVTRSDRVYTLGRSGGVSRLYCIRAVTGQVDWGAPVPAAVFQSWASPSVDDLNGNVLVASGRFVTAINALTGAQMWQTEMDLSNAGATVAVTDDLKRRNRAFITDYDGFGVGGKLYCINVDPLSETNPYQPGEMVWSVVLGSTSANTPAYAAGVVYVASVSDATGTSPGTIRAFSADATSPPGPLWTFTNVEPPGFFGGVCVSGGAVYAAGYAFSGGQLSANLVKVDAATGALRWSAASNRTDTIPVPMNDGTVLLSAGIRGFGCVPSVERFRDDGASAALLWDTALASWHDDNGNGQLDSGEYLDVGGWTIQPAYGAGPGGKGYSVYVGVAPPGASTTAGCSALLNLNVSLTPSNPAFIRESVVGTGASPAITSRGLYTIGSAGVFAFGPAPCAANCDGSSVPPVLNANDFQCFLGRYAVGDLRANCDGSTTSPVLNANDFLCYLNAYAAGCP